MKNLKITERLGYYLYPEERISSGFKLLSKYRSAIMGFSALWIIFFHLWNTVITMDTPHMAWIESRIKRFGYCGVDIFFFISGAGLTYAIAKSKLPAFYYRRIKRIIIPFLAVALIKAKLDHWSPEWFFSVISGKAFYTVSIYMFLWFVPAILTLYLLFPLYWLGFRKTGPYFWTGTMLLVWFFCILAFRDKIRGDMFGFLNRIPVFMLGVLAGHLMKTKSGLSFKKRTYIPVFLLFALGIYMLELTNFSGYYVLVPSSNCFLPTLLTAVTLPFLLAKLLNLLESVRILCVPGKIITGILNFFGSFSIEMYCLQEWFAGLQRDKFAELEYTPMEVNITLFSEIIIISFISSLIIKYFWVIAELPFKRLVSALKKNKMQRA